MLAICLFIDFAPVLPVKDTGKANQVPGGRAAYAELGSAQDVQGWGGWLAGEATGPYQG